MKIICDNCAYFDILMNSDGSKEYCCVVRDKEIKDPETEFCAHFKGYKIIGVKKP